MLGKQPDAKERNWITAMHTNKLQMDWKLECEIGNHRSPRRKHE